MRHSSRLRGGAVVVAAVACFGMTPGTPALAATPTIQITKVYYDSPASDDGSNGSLNAEYVVLRNTTRAAINLTGWTVRDRARHVYTFGTGVTLGSGRSVTLHTGRGTNSAAHRYWGSRYYVWNNTGDAAYVRNRAGREIDAC